ncbi:MAG: hypothetical protein ACRC6U_09105 [Fusobacteriaceae bacterium]
MQVIGFGFKRGKPYANIQWKSGNVTPAYFNHDGVELWDGCPHKLTETVKVLLLTREVWDLSGTFQKIIPEDLQWIGKQVATGLIDLEKGCKCTHSNFDFRRNKKINDYGGKGYAKLG